MKKFNLLLLFVVLTSSVFAQIARVQVIHNSADPAAATVDVWLDNTLLFDDLDFREATPFVDAPATTSHVIAVAPSNSTMPSQALQTFNVQFQPNETYVVVADGVVGTGFNPTEPFDLKIFAGARESATMMGNTDVLVHHGSTDAPTVDVVEVGVGAGTIVDDLAYGLFASAGYLELGTNDYRLEVRDMTGMNTVASYEAPLATLGLQGGAAVVVASGFLDPSMNNNGAPFGLYVALPTGGMMTELPGSTARLQVIHNSADAAASEVDIYLDGNLLIDDFAFRTASAFIDAPAGREISVAVAPGNSTSVAQALATVPLTLEANETYVAIANGIVSTSGYMPATPFSLDVYDMGRESASMMTNTDVLVFHGATDAPTVDVEEIEVEAGTIVDDLAYGEFQGYLELGTDDYRLAVQDETGAVTVRSYEAPLEALSLDGAAAVVVASGFLDPSMNSNGPAFGLWVALPAGGALVELPQSTARLQVIHNSADAAAATVDIYLDDALLIDDFAFRTATAFIDAPSERTINIGVAPGNSSSASESLAVVPFTLETGDTYIAIANGHVSTMGYDPLQPFAIDVFADAREEADDAANTDVLVYHGSTDAPTVDVVESLVGAGTIVDDLAYTDFAGYLELAPANYLLEIRDETGDAIVTGFDAPLADLGLDGAAITVLASGYLDPAANSDGAAFGLYVALAAGGDLVALNQAYPLGAGEVDNTREIKAYPNPASGEIFLEVAPDENIGQVQVFDIRGQLVRTMQALESRTMIDVQTLPAGVYLLQVQNETGLTNLQIIKE